MWFSGFFFVVTPPLTVQINLPLTLNLLYHDQIANFQGLLIKTAEKPKIYCMHCVI